jgi:hypothetical protein
VFFMRYLQYKYWEILYLCKINKINN